MILDSTLQFASATSIVGGTGMALLGSQIDTAYGGQLDADDLYFVITVAQAITASAAGSIRFQLASAIGAAVPTDGSATALMQTGDIPTGLTPIPAGSVLFVGELPKNSGIYNPNKRYLGLLSVIGTSAITGGSISAFLTPDGGRWAAGAIPLN